MKELTKEMKNELFESINAVRTSAGLKAIDPKATRTVGNNGRSIGETGVLTGEINPAVEVKDVNGKTTATYIGLKTDKGDYISLQSLMGITSMNGYSVNEAATHEWDEKVGTKTEKQSKEVKPEVAEGFDFSEMWKPKYRDLYDEAAYLMANPEEIKDKTYTYWGTVVRQITAKKDAPATSFEKYKTGYKRAMSARMFSLA